MNKDIDNLISQQNELNRDNSANVERPENEPVAESDPSKADPRKNNSPDDDFLEDGEWGDQDYEFEGGPKGDSNEQAHRPRKVMFCFHCNRPEGHHLAFGNRWFYSFMIGLSFGMVKFIGPFRCQCCGEKRLMSSDRANIKYWRRVAKDVKRSGARRRKKSKKSDF